MLRVKPFSLFVKIIFYRCYQISYVCVFFFTLFNYLYWKNITFMFPCLFMIYQRYIVTYQSNLFMQTTLFFSFTYFRKSLTHNCYKHVHKYNAIKKSSHTKHNPTTNYVRTLWKRIIRKLSNCDKVCRNKSVKNLT